MLNVFRDFVKDVVGLTLNPVGYVPKSWEENRRDVKLEVREAKSISATYPYRHSFLPTQISQLS